MGFRRKKAAVGASESDKFFRVAWRRLATEDLDAQGLFLVEERATHSAQFLPRMGAPL